jgi:NAD(P)-dependent dehydrogenase (short-subunit alcohol dehydrogenase family)
MKLKDRVAIITGGASGIGRATAEIFAQEGAHVALFDIWQAGGKAAAAKIGKLGRKAIYVHCDVSSEAQVEAGVRRAVETFGKIDILFNNAGGGVSPDDPPQVRGSTPIDELSEGDWDKVVDSHLKGCFLCSKHVVRQMKRQNTGGAIVNTSAVAGLVGVRFQHAYGSAKHGIIGLTKEMALELVDYHIRVNAIAPGATVTNMLRQNNKEVPQATLDGLKQRYPMKRAAQPEEIAKGVLYLASDDASFVTGAVLSIDGGLVAG